MSLIYIVIWGFVILAGVTSVTALAWSIRTDQWRATPEDASVIFHLDDAQSAPQSRSKRSTLSTRGE